MIIIDDHGPEMIVPKHVYDELQLQSRLSRGTNTSVTVVYRELPEGIQDGDLIDGVRHCKARGDMFSDVLAKIAEKLNKNKHLRMS